MCGIAGSIGNLEIDGMVQSQTHRGPDNLAITRGEVSLGHNRLSIVDLSPNSNQPISTEHGTLVFNGEIYNHKEFGYSSDTLFLSNLFKTDGFERNLEKLTGMFAIAYHDKTKNKLFLAVDRLGEKPLYWRQRFWVCKRWKP